MNGIWCLLLLGRTGMVTGWYEMIRGKVKPNTEFISADVSRFKDPGSYEMLGRDATGKKTPEPLSAITTTTVTSMMSTPAATAKSGRETPDYFGREARYKSPSRSFSAPKPPQGASPMASWDSQQSHAAPRYYAGMDPLSMNKL
jgi:hypothetical protein